MLLMKMRYESFVVKVNRAKQRMIGFLCGCFAVPFTAIALFWIFVNDAIRNPVVIGYALLAIALWQQCIVRLFFKNEPYIVVEGNEIQYIKKSKTIKFTESDICTIFVPTKRIVTSVASQTSSTITANSRNEIYLADGRKLTFPQSYENATVFIHRFQHKVPKKRG